MLVVEDLEQLKKEEFDATAENSNSSMIVVEVRKEKAEFHKAHDNFERKTDSTKERNSSGTPETSLRFVTARW